MPTTSKVARGLSLTVVAAAMVFGANSASVARAQTTAPAGAHAGDGVTITGGDTVFSDSAEVLISGTSNLAPGSQVTVAIGTDIQTTDVRKNGTWSIQWPTLLETGTYPLTVTVADPNGGVSRATADLRVNVEGKMPRQPLGDDAREYAINEKPNTEDFQEFSDRWHVAPPPGYENIVAPRRKHFDPYNQNLIKGDLPFFGSDVFLSLTGISDTLMEYHKLPTPSGLGSARPDSRTFFGEGNQLVAVENVFVTADLFKGDTAYRPIDWRVRATIAGNVNHVNIHENGGLNTDVRKGTDRTDGQISVQELFYERKLHDLTSNFDFVSVRAGIQPFSSDFRGFIFTDTNLGVRFFGNYNSNRWQYNLAYFDRLEKDTNSGLNISFERRDQKVIVANVYKQDFFVQGYTAEFNYHHLQDNGKLLYDSNNFLVRPDPIGDFKPHHVMANYFGWAGLGKIGRFNVDHGFYYVRGNDSQNPIAGIDPIGGPVDPKTGVRLGRKSVDISAQMAAIEISYDRDYLRPRLAYFYTSGDGNPTDRHAKGFASIFENPSFAGGGFSFWNRMGIRLAGSGVALTQRGSLTPELNSSKEEGQPNFVNPGIHLFSAGLDVDFTPKLKGIFTGNYLLFDKTAVLNGVLFQGNIKKEIGTDLSAGLKYRPYLNNNVVVVGGAAVFLPGTGFKNIYEDDAPLYHLFTNIIFTF